VRRDGRRIPVFIGGGMLPGMPDRGVVFAIDLTERKQAEEAVRQSEERYRNVVETQTELICRNLPDTTLTFVNDPYDRYFRKTREQLVGTKFLELIPEPVHPVVLQHIETLVKNPSIGTSEHEHKVLNPDGSIGWQHWTNRVFIDSSGCVTELQAIGRVITQRKRAEQALEDLVAAKAGLVHGVYAAYGRHGRAGLAV